MTHRDSLELDQNENLDEAFDDVVDKQFSLSAFECCCTTLIENQQVEENVEEGEELMEVVMEVDDKWEEEDNVCILQVCFGQ